VTLLQWRFGMRMASTLAAAFFLGGVALLGQSATVHGEVRDSQGKPVAGAAVFLTEKSADRNFTTKADTQGRYRFSDLHAGSYTLRAQAAAAGETAADSFTLAETETRKVDLTVQAAFFDEPGFIVAGVTDTMSRGGHGSDTVLRSAESLAKATASLSTESPAAAAEKQGNALEAVREYQRAAERDSSEANLFNWGAELLKHRAAEPAREVFTKGNRMYPGSLRMLLGLAVSWYARGSYGEAARRFFEACDLDPGNPEPYMFLGKVQSIEITELEGYAQRLGRFADRFPGNAWADYYYAVSLWKQRKGPEDVQTPTRVRELLEKAVRIDPALGAAYLQLGIVYAGQNDYARAIAAYQKAIEVSPRMEEAHYRLGQVYERTGDKEKARTELQAYAEMSKKSAEEADRERAEIRQFVFELRGK